MSTNDDTARLAAQQADLDQFIATTRGRTWGDFVMFFGATIASNVAEALELDPADPPDQILARGILNADYALHVWLATNGDVMDPLLD